VSVSVALIGEIESGMPLGAVTVAVSEIVPVADELILALALQVNLEEAGNFIVSLILPLPVVVNPEAPPLCQQ
jgi:hypothetical protein